MAMRFLRPDRLLVPGTVTGTVDADFTPAWLIDGRPTFPIKRSGDLDLTATPPSALNCDCFALFSHTVTAGIAAVLTRNGGTAIGSIVPPTWGLEGIPANAYLLLGAAVSVTSLRMQITGNTGAIVIGNLYAGLSTLLETDFAPDRLFDPGAPVPWDSLMPPNDDGMGSARKLSGSMVLTDAGLATLIDLYAATKKGTIPTPIIPDDSVNDAYLATWSFTATHGEGFHKVTLQLQERQRTRW